MSDGELRSYDVDDHVVEIYDQTETQIQDVVLLRQQLGTVSPRRILEPFCSNGRILIPLAQDGHELVGMDKSAPMLRSAERKLRGMARDTRERIELHQLDVLENEWPSGFDLVLLAGNCFYELPTADAQAHCIRAAARSLEPNGYLYLDNNHMEGELPASWCSQDLQESAFPSGVCADGTVVRGTSQVVWFDRKARLVRSRRSVQIDLPDGSSRTREWIQQKHPPSTEEMRQWLTEGGFTVLELWGDRVRTPYTAESGRAIFWAQRNA